MGHASIHPTGIQKRHLVSWLFFTFLVRAHSSLHPAAVLHHLCEVSAFLSSSRFSCSWCLIVPAPCAARHSAADVDRKSAKMSMQIILLLLLITVPSYKSFNIDTDTSLIHRGPPGTYFGFSVSQHKDGRASW